MFGLYLRSFFEFFIEKGHLVQSGKVIDSANNQ